ncbi:MAG TPA: HAD family hydrolase [Myxococcaceae bacterium]|nr:HAD family hydrolase [Myxococcaceae bacterium]
MAPRAATRLRAAEARARAARIRLVLADCDGVLTDTGVYYSETGELMKRFSIRDGMGVERLRQAGIESGIISGERSPSIARRAEKLGIPHLLLGAKDKRAEVEELCARHGLRLAELAYIGDDVNDLQLLEAVGAEGLTGAPLDALPEVASRVHHRGAVPAGQGALRDFAEWILALRR